MRACSWRLSAIVFFGIGLMGSLCLAQQKAPPKMMATDEKGTLESVNGSTIMMKTAKNEVWYIALDNNTKVAVTGTAEADYLKGGLAIHFSGEIDAKGVLQGEPIKEVEIFTPVGKNALGLFPVGADSDAKPAKKLEAGSYDIKGKLTKYKDNEFTMTVAGKTVTGKIAPDAAISVNLSNLNEAQPGDSVSAKLTYPEHGKPNVEKMTPGKALADTIDISLTNPLSRAKKGKAPKGKAGKGGDKPVKDLFKSK